MDEPLQNDPLRVTRANTILYCAHWAETVHFYRAILGMTVAFENDWFVEFRIADTAMLSIADASRATIRAVDGQGVTLTWQVESTQAMREALLSRGVAVGPVTDRFGSKVCHFQDPEGHRLEAWTPNQ